MGLGYTAPPIRPSKSRQHPKPRNAVSAAFLGLRHWQLVLEVHPIQPEHLATMEMLLN